MYVYFVYFKLYVYFVYFKLYVYFKWGTQSVPLKNDARATTHGKLYRLLEKVILLRY